MCTEQSLWMTLIYLHSRGMCFGTNALCIVHIWFPNQTLKMFAFNCITTVTAAGLECQYLHILLKTFTCVQGPRTIREIWALVSAGWDLFIFQPSFKMSQNVISQRKYSISGTDLPASGCKGCIRQLHAELQLGLQIKSSTMHTCTVTV